MTNLPITRMILFKHGIAYLERRAQWRGDRLALTVRIGEMNDLLKSLTIIDEGDGRVIGVEYATPQDRVERLSGCSVQPGGERSFQDLLVSLRGRRVELQFDQNEAWRGILLGIDRPPSNQPITAGTVSILLEESATVQYASIGHMRGVKILDDTGTDDLRFFLGTLLTTEQHAEVVVHLTPGDHDLCIGYIIPAPSWRVSYRFVVTPDEGVGERVQTVLMGWGIFDNQLEEDLAEINLSLVAGMPISFVYDLYKPAIPERHVVHDDKRTIAGPVMLEAAGLVKGLGAMPQGIESPVAELAIQGITPEAFSNSVMVGVAGKERGALFQYDVAMPVTVGRGQSALVPIVSARLPGRRNLVYNSEQFEEHPVAVLRVLNNSGVALERGPVTVIDDDGYAGEAILAFTPIDREIVIPYAVELGVSVKEEAGTDMEMHSIRVDGHYLRIEEWVTQWREVVISNETNRPKRILIDQAYEDKYALYESPQPVEQTASFLRFAVDVPANDRSTLRIQLRKSIARREEIVMHHRQSLEAYLTRAQLNRGDKARLTKVIDAWSELASLQSELDALGRERKGIYEAQEQMRANLSHLATDGEEGKLRADFVNKLRSSEEQLERVNDQLVSLSAKKTKLSERAESILREEF